MLFWNKYGYAITIYCILTAVDKFGCHLSLSLSSIVNFMDKKIVWIVIIVILVGVGLALLREQGPQRTGGPGQAYIKPLICFGPGNDPDCEGATPGSICLSSVQRRPGTCVSNSLPKFTNGYPTVSCACRG